MQTKKDGRYYQFYVATDERAMRGTNLIGRYYDPCQRQKLEHVPLVDNNSELQLRQGLFAFNQAHGTA